LQLLGIKREDLGVEETTEIWPENWKSFQVFNRMGNRWLRDMNGPICLDMSAYHLFTRRCRVAEDEWDEVLDAVQVMENAALATVAEHQARKQKR
jgi:hypothetical protein